MARRDGSRTRNTYVIAAGVLVVAGLMLGACSSSKKAPAPRPATTLTAATATTDAGPRPSGVPAQAQLLRSAAQYGDPAGSGSAGDERLNSPNCAKDLLTITTTKHIVYAELPCDRSLPSKDAQAFLSQPVRVRAVIASPSKLYLESKTGGTVEFTVGRVWVRAAP
ncbi:MAG: hypothetical protein ACYDEB_08130 [Dehalococcoidia bacterium]